MQLPAQLGTTPGSFFKALTSWVAVLVPVLTLWHGANGAESNSVPAVGELKPIILPQPELGAGKPLMRALEQRRTTREFKTNALPEQVLGNVLWAGFGINRPATGHRTAPSAMNSQEIDIYVALPAGLYVYEPKPHQLKPVMRGDFRPLTGQTFSRQAPVTLIYVSDLPRLSKADPGRRSFYATFDCGCISQNVYLYCASEGLASVVHDLDRKPLTVAMKLVSGQEIVLAQAVGFPK